METAIKVCRQAGYHHHALSLAEKHQKHEWYLKIQLEDIRDYQAALLYIGRLEFEAVSIYFFLFLCFKFSLSLYPQIDITNYILTFWEHIWGVS